MSERVRRISDPGAPGAPGPTFYISLKRRVSCYDAPLEPNSAPPVPRRAPPVLQPPPRRRKPAPRKLTPPRLHHVPRCCNAAVFFNQPKEDAEPRSRSPLWSQHSSEERSPSSSPDVKQRNSPPDVKQRNSPPDVKQRNSPPDVKQRNSPQLTTKRSSPLLVPQRSSPLLVAQRGLTQRGPPVQRRVSASALERPVVAPARRRSGTVVNPFIEALDLSHGKQMLPTYYVE